jgi:hypothetical protein
MEELVGAGKEEIAERQKDGIKKEGVESQYIVERKRNDLKGVFGYGGGVNGEMKRGHG